MATELKKNDPEKARQYFADKMAFSTGPVEVSNNLKQGTPITVVDVREAEHPVGELGLDPDGHDCAILLDRTEDRLGDDVRRVTEAERPGDGLLLIGQLADHARPRRDRRADEPRTDRADADAAARPVGTQALRQADHGRLRRAVRGHVAVRHVAGAGGEECAADGG